MEVLEFGFVPKHIVADLQDIGNWKSRATAIDSLHKALRDVLEKSQLLAGLPKFVGFLMQLVADPNFKIAISSMQILGDLVAKVGRDVEPHLKSIIPNLVEKFTDSKVLVRSANLKVLKKLMAVTQPRAVLELLGAGMSHSSWRVREEVVNAGIMALLLHDRGSVDTSQAFRLFASGMSDSKERVKAVALEGMAVLASKTSSGEMNGLLSRGGLTEAQKQQVQQRMANSALPSVNIDGIVEHVIDMPHADPLESISADIPPRRQGSMAAAAGNKLPWDVPQPRPRLRGGADPAGLLETVPDKGSGAGGYSHSNSSANLGPPALLALPTPPAGTASPLAPVRLGGIVAGGYGRYGSGGYASGAAAVAAGGADSWSPASYSPTHAPAASGRPTKDSDSSGSGSGGAQAASSGYEPSSRLRSSTLSVSSIPPPPLGAPIGTGPSVGSYHLHHHYSSSTSAYPSTSQSKDAGGVRDSSTSINLNGLAALKHHREAITSRSIEASGGGGLSARSPDISADADSSSSPLTPPRASYRALLGAGSSSQGGASDGGGKYANDRSNHNSGALSGESILDGALGYGAGPGAASRNVGQASSNPLRASNPNPPLGGQSGDIGMLWLHPKSLDTENQARAETFSPSKGELLAKLKSRQIEKRANSAQLPTRPGGAASDSELPTSMASGYAVLHGAGMGGMGLADKGAAAAAAPAAGSYAAQAAARRGLFQAISQTNNSNNSGRGEEAQGGWLAAGSRSRAGGSYSGSGASPSGNGAGSYTEDVPVGGYRAGAGAGAAGPLSSRQPASGNSLLAARLGRGPSPLPLASMGSGDSDRLSGGQGAPTLQSPIAAALSRLTPSVAERLRARSADLHTAGSATSAPPSVHGGSSGVGAGGANSYALRAPGGFLSAPVANNPSGALSNRGGTSNNVPSSAASGSSFWEKGRQVGIEELATADLTPIAEPERALRAVIAKMLEANTADRKELDWQGHYEALNDARRLVRHHPEVIRGSLHEFVRAAVPAVEMLRSTSVKNALSLFQEMFASLGRGLDRELDEMVPSLLKKAGEVSNAGRENFLAQEADRALTEMCRCCSEARSILALCACSGHKNMYVRSRVASQLDGLLEMYGPHSMRAVLQGNSQCLDRLFKTAAGFLDEGALDTRTYGKRIIWHVKGVVGSKAEFDRLVALVSPDFLQRKVIDTVEGSNGPPPPPVRGTGGPGGSRSVSRQMSGGDNRGSPGPTGPGGGVLSGRALQDARDEKGYSLSAPVGGGIDSGGGYYGSAFGAGGPRGAGAGAAAGNATPERKRALQALPSWRSRTAEQAAAGGDSGAPTPSARGLPRSQSFSAAAAEGLGKALSSLSSKDFRERLEALKALEGLAEQGLGGAPEGQLVQLLDSMTARLGDGNSKVAVAAGEVLGKLFGALRERTALGLNTLVPALAAGMGSTNDKVRVAAASATDALVASVDPSLLVQNFAHCVSAGHLRGKPLLVERLQALIPALWPGRPQLVTKHVVPAAFSLLNDTKGDGKAAAQALLGSLAQQMGPQLLEQAANLQPHLQAKVAEAVSAAGYRC